MAKDKKIKAQIERQLAALSKQQQPGPANIIQQLPSTISYPGLIEHSLIKKDILKIAILIFILFGLLVSFYILSLKTTLFVTLSQRLFNLLNLQ